MVPELPGVPLRLRVRQSSVVRQVHGLGQRRVVVRRGEEPLHGKLRGAVVPAAVEPAGPGAGADVNTAEPPSRPSLCSGTQAQTRERPALGA